MMHAMKPKPEDVRIPITLRALLERVRRRHTREGRTFYVSRGEQAKTGRYFLVDANNHVVDAKINDLEAHAREIGALQPFERLKAKKQ